MSQVRILSARPKALLPIGKQGFFFLILAIAGAAWTRTSCRIRYPCRPLSLWLSVTICVLLTGIGLALIVLSFLKPRPFDADGAPAPHPRSRFR